MIRKVSFRNFKAYRSLGTELEPLTVLVGSNASGKTTLLEGLSLVSSELAVLEQRGGDNGLTAYLSEVRGRLVPVLSGRAPEN